MPVIRRLRADHRASVVWLLTVFALLLVVRFGLMEFLLDEAGGLRSEDVLRTRLLDVGLLFVALGSGVAIVSLRFERAVLGVVDVAERIDQDAAEARRREEQSADNANLFAGLAADLADAADRADPDRSRSVSLGAIRRLVRGALRLADVVGAQRQGLRLDVDRFGLRRLLASVADTAGADGVPVTSLVRDDVPDSLRGDEPRLRRALGSLIDSAARETGASRLLVSVGARQAGAEVELEFEVRDESTAPLSPGDRSEWAVTQVPTTVGTRATLELARGLGGALSVSARSDGTPRYNMTIPVTRHAADEVDATGDWQTVPTWEADDLLQPVADEESELERSDQTGPWVRTEARLAGSGGGIAARRRDPAWDEAADTSPLPRLIGAATFDEDFEHDTDQLERSGAWRVEDSQILDAIDSSSGVSDALSEDAIFTPPMSHAVGRSPRVRRTTGTTPVLHERDSGAHAAAFADEDGRAASLGRGRRVLVVDDDAMARWSLTGQLSLFGFAVDSVGGGRQALLALAKRAYDAVVLDTYMPDMNGFQTAARIRASVARPNVPIIALSDIDSEGERARCTVVGIDAFMRKPVDGHQLAEAIDREAASRAAATTAEQPASQPASEDEDALDPDVMSRLEGIQEASEQPDLVRRMIGSFIERADNSFRAFELGLVESDSALIRVTAERLRRSCATLGAVRMEEISGQLSSAMSSGTLDVAIPLVRSLEAEFERVRPMLLARA